MTVGGRLSRRGLVVTVMVSRGFCNWGRRGRGFVMPVMCPSLSGNGGQGDKSPGGAHGDYGPDDDGHGSFSISATQGHDDLDS